ncbi:hypothetical protein FOZ63_006010 [Perkinsus olseni]|uniref:Uncharacterized protein n=1 Tax=Perkinsus olseni TaxID=32597 RepID=A0A7J6QU17_PEROL|nr:hypothetical protein FOZ63_006010 [Perkinsus olseni]
MGTRDAWQPQDDDRTGLPAVRKEPSGDDLQWDDTHLGGSSRASHRSRFVISPEDTKRIVWDFFQMVFILYESILVPYRLCFKQDASGLLEVLEDALYIFFLLDIALNFFTGVYISGHLVRFFVASPLKRHQPLRSCRSHGGATIGYLSEGGYFGEVALFMETSRSASAKCLSFCDTICLSRQSLLDLLVIYPKFRLKYDALCREVLSGDVRGLCLQCVHCGKIGHLSDMCQAYTNVIKAAEAFQRGPSGPFTPARARPTAFGTANSATALDSKLKSRMTRVLTRAKTAGAIPVSPVSEGQTPTRSEPDESGGLGLDATPVPGPGKEGVVKNADSDRIVTTLFTHAQRRVAAAIAHRHRATQQKGSRSSSGRRSSRPPGTNQAAAAAINTTSPAIHSQRPTFANGPPYSSRMEEPRPEQGIIAEEGLPSALLPSSTDRDPRRELKEEAQLVGELAFLGDLTCLAKLHHQKELFAEVDKELDRMDDDGPPSSPSGVHEGYLNSPRLRLLNPSEPRRPSEWGEVRRLLLATMMGRVPTDKLPIPLLWDMLVPGLETLPIPLLLATDFPERMSVDGDECPCMQRAEPCLCLSPEEWREAWRGLKRHRSKARDQLSQSSVANPFADPLLRSICSGVSERLHRMEREESREGLLGIPEGVEEQLILLGEYMRRAVYPGTCAAQALAAVLPTLVEVKGLLKAFHVEVRRQNEGRAAAELRAGSLDSLSPMQSMRTPRPGDLYRWRRLMIALGWTASALLDCSDAVMAEGILATLLDIPVAATPSASPGSLPSVAHLPPLYTLLTPVLAAAFFPESVEDSGLWVHPEVEDRRLALDRLRLLTAITTIINVIRRALGSTKDTPTVYVQLAARLSSAWAAIAQHSAPVVMGTWMASVFAHGIGVIPRFLTSRTPLHRLDGATTPEALLELKLAEAEIALFSIPAELNDFLVEPHVGWYIHHHYSRFIRLYRRRSTVSSPSVGSPSSTSSYASTAQPCQQETPIEDSLAVAQLGVLRALGRARSPGARKKFHSLRVVDFLCGEIDLEHAAYHMEGRYREFTSRGGQGSRTASDAGVNKLLMLCDEGGFEVGLEEEEEEEEEMHGRSCTVLQHSPSKDVPGRAAQQEADYPKVPRKVVVPGLSFTGLAPSTQGCAALLGAAPAEEVSRDPTTAAVGGGGSEEEPLVPPPTALPPATHAEDKDYRRSLSAPLPPPVSYSDCGDVAREDGRIEGIGSSSSSSLSSSSSPCSSRLPAATALSPPVVPRLAFQGLPPSVQGPAGLGIDPTPPEYVTGGVAKESPQTPQPSGQIPPLTTIDDAEGYRDTGRAATGRGRPRLIPELFYDCGRKCRRLYRSEELQEGVLQLLLLLLLSATRGTLDCRYSDQFPALNGKVNVLFMLSVHLSHKSNIRALRRLRHHEGIPSVRSCPSSPHRGVFRLLKLLAPGNFPQWIYADMRVVGGGAFGTVYRCETVLDGGDEEVVAVKLVSRNPNISDRCVLYDVFNEVTCLEEGRFDDYMAEIFDYGYDGSSYWIIMRFYGMTLTAWRSSFAQSLGDHLLDLLQAYRKILTAVGKLHRDGLVHYDLKCDNIMLTSTARGSSSSGIAVVLADFGESRVLEGPQNTDLCVRNRGTEFVKPPEMLTMERALRRDDAAFDRRRSVGTTTASDVWSLGCMLYELITGQYLFYNDDWIRFFMRLTGGLTGRGVEGGRHGSPATAMPLDILTEENIEKLDNNASLCDFIRQGGWP